MFIKNFINFNTRNISLLPDIFCKNFGKCPGKFRNSFFFQKTYCQAPNTDNSCQIVYKIYQIAVNAENEKENEHFFRLN